MSQSRAVRYSILKLVLGLTAVLVSSPLTRAGDIAADRTVATTIAQSNTNYTQQVVRLNPKRDPGNKPAYTVADCFVSENCLPWLSRTILQVGGNPALLASATQEQKSIRFRRTERLPL